MVHGMNINVCNISISKCIKKAVEVIRKRGIIVYPTDTVYGIGGDPFDINVVNRITHLKGRSQKPYPILISNRENAYKIIEYNEIVDELINEFWPGPLTIVYKARYGFPANLFRRKVGVRVPNHIHLLKLIDLADGYVIGTSANIADKPPSRSVDMAIRYFREGVDLYLDGGETGSISSTVVEVSDNSLHILREGLVDRRDLEKFCSRFKININSR